MIKIRLQGTLEEIERAKNTIKTVFNVLSESWIIRYIAERFFMAGVPTAKSRLSRNERFWRYRGIMNRLYLWNSGSRCNRSEKLIP